MPTLADPEWKETAEATADKARALYLTLFGCTETPGEAAQIIVIMYVNLWLQCSKSQDPTGLETALSEFCETVRMNIAKAQREGETMQ